MKDVISALTFDTQKDGWQQSTGFVKREIEKPTLDEKENPADALSVILKVNYAGICGSDRGIWHRQSFRELIHQSLEKEGKATRLLGHEFVGEVMEVGSLVEHLYEDRDPDNQNTVKVGAVVSGDSHVTCGRCFNCRIGEQHVCMDDSILGISRNGVFAPYVKLPAKNLWPVDTARIRPEIAAIYDPFGNAVHAASVADVKGARVAVFGCGQIGLFTILLLRQFGAAKIIGIDPNPHNLAIAKELGAHETILLEQVTDTSASSADAAITRKISELTYGKGVDVSFELSGFNSSINNAIESTRRGGHIILFGIKDGDVVIPDFSRVVVKGLTFHSVIGRKIFSTWQVAQRMLHDKTNGIQDAIWKTILQQGKGTILPFSAYEPAALEEAMAENPKLILDMHN